MNNQGIQQSEKTFLAQNHWDWKIRCTVISTGRIEPIFLSIFFDEYKNTFFVKVVWFSLRPCWEPARQWSTVHPVKLIVYFSVQSNPCTTISPVWLAHYKAKYEVVLIGRFDYRRMCSVILTKRECIVPSWSRSVMNKVAWILMTKPTLRAILLVNRSWQKIRSCHFQNIIITMNMKGLYVTGNDLNKLSSSDMLV